MQKALPQPSLKRVSRKRCLIGTVTQIKECRVCSKATEKKFREHIPIHSLDLLSSFSFPAVLTTGLTPTGARMQQTSLRSSLPISLPGHEARQTSMGTNRRNQHTLIAQSVVRRWVFFLLKLSGALNNGGFFLRLSFL